MIAINYTSARQNFKKYCDLACDEEETVIITRKDNKNVVIISLEKYNRMEKIYKI